MCNNGIQGHYCNCCYIVIQGHCCELRTLVPFVVAVCHKISKVPTVNYKNGLHSSCCIVMYFLTMSSVPIITMCPKMTTGSCMFPSSWEK
jgi:hypothetical protein